MGFAVIVTGPSVIPAASLPSVLPVQGAMITASSRVFGPNGSAPTMSSTGSRPHISVTVFTLSAALDRVSVVAAAWLMMVQAPNPRRQTCASPQTPCRRCKTAAYCKSYHDVLPPLPSAYMRVLLVCSQCRCEVSCQRSPELPAGSDNARISFMPLLPRQGRHRRVLMRIYYQLPRRVLLAKFSAIHHQAPCGHHC